MKKIYALLTSLLLLPLGLFAQGWPAAYNGVMLQGFYWDSFDASKWTNLEAQAEELSQYFSLVWIPQSGNCGGLSMGYDDLYWFQNYDSSFGTKAELQSLISTFKSHGIGTIADVVINHRKTLSGWTDFPSETYNGTTYHLLPTDIVSNDEAAGAGYTVGSNPDTGEGWDGMRDLDHNSPNVQANVKAYLKMLLGDLGYAGFRYDMVKGYAARFTGIYNTDSKPTYSVGEYWDGNITNVQNWIEGTKVNGTITSAAFDFPLRYTVRDAVNNGIWSNLNTGSGLAKTEQYRRYAVTFVENHDTERRSNAAQDPILKDTLAANAYILAMPGTPCIFLKHWTDCKQDIKQMIDVRRLVGITNESNANTAYISGTGYQGIQTTGTKGDLVAIIGSGAGSYQLTAAWAEIASGYHWRYFVRKSSTETAWADLPGGTYDGEQQVTLKAISANTTQLVYTLDGTEPTAASTKATNGQQITIPVGTTVLKVGLLVAGTVKGVITRTYTVNDFKPYTIKVYVNAESAGTAWAAASGGINYWTWGGDGSHSPRNASWPGDKITAKETQAGKSWFVKSFNINASTDFVNFVFSIGTGAPQTVNVENVKQNSYFEISSEQEGANYKVNNVTDVVTGIRGITTDAAPSRADVYTLDGRFVRSASTVTEAVSGLNKGVYIVGGKKYIVR